MERTIFGNNSRQFYKNKLLHYNTRDTEKNHDHIQPQ